MGAERARDFAKQAGVLKLILYYYSMQMNVKDSKVRLPLSPIRQVMGA
jgi:ribonuclease BN (tRNA processing enzyme)